MIEPRRKGKWTAFIIILAFIFYFNNGLSLHPQEADELLNQFMKAKRAYLNGQYIDSRNRLERIMDSIIPNSDRNAILGHCYLLLGAINEKKGDNDLAWENYQKAIKISITTIPDVTFKYLPLYKKVMKERVIEHPGKRGKKKFPYLFLIEGVVVVAVLAILLINNKMVTYTLKTTLGDGVVGSPQRPSRIYQKGATVYYNYRIGSGFANLVVTLDGTEVASSGTITMNKNHILNATSNRQFSLTVNRGTGVDGVPVSGTTYYNDGQVVNYSYTLAEDFTNLRVILDSALISTVGTITMNQNHTLTVITDALKPKVSITSPANNSSYSRGTIVVFQVEATSVVAIDKVEFWIDGQLVGEDRTTPYNFQWNTSSYATGVHTIRVIAYDIDKRMDDVQITVNLTQ